MGEVTSKELNTLTLKIKNRLIEKNDIDQPDFKRFEQLDGMFNFYLKNKQL